MEVIVDVPGQDCTTLISSPYILQSVQVNLGLLVQTFGLHFSNEIWYPGMNILG